MLWIATVTIQSLLTALLLGPLFTPSSLTIALKLNGTTTTTTAATPSVNSTSGDNVQTTIASFLQPDISETTLGPHQLSNQADELTTTQDYNISPSQSVSSSSSSPLTKRHSSIAVGEPSSQNDDSPKFITKASLSPSSSSTEKVEDSKEKPQRNGTRLSPINITSNEDGDGGEQSLSLSSTETTAEQNSEDDNPVPSTTGRDNSSKNDSTEDDEEERASASTNNSLGNDQPDSLSSGKDESSDDTDTYFSAGDDTDNDNNNGNNEGDSDAARGGGGGEIGGDTIFPPEEDGELDTNESEGATTFASLLRPAPTTNPQAFSFSSQLANKLNRSGGGSRQGNSRLGTRGLSAKSELNAITTTTTTSTTTTTTEKPPSTNNGFSNNDSVADSATASDSSISASEVVINQEKNNVNNNNRNNDSSTASNISSDNFNSNNNDSFVLSASSFQSRSNANLHPQQQQHQSPHLLRARPTSSVINSYNSNTNHNNNLHNRIIKRKKIPFGRGNNTSSASGSSLSSIYENSILTSTVSSGSLSGDEENVEITTPTSTTAAQSSSVLDIALLSTSTSGVSATTESTNSLLNASHDNNGDDDTSSSRRNANASNKNADEGEANQQQSSAASTSGSGGTSAENSSSSNSSSNTSAPLSSSRAILGFGTSPSSSSSSSYGKVKRPKPIIIRDRDDSVYVNNLPENSAQAGGAASGSVDETATNSGAGGGGEEESNKPVGNNALPTPPYKVRRVKLTSRRVSMSTVTRPTEDYDVVSPTAPTFVVPSVSASATDFAEINNTNSLMAQAASGVTDYRQRQQHVIRPSIAHEGYNQHPDAFTTSRRVYKEEFGITRNSYGNRDDHRDANADDDDGELQATTEYFSLENPTPYPIPMGVRSAPQQVEESDDNEEQTGRSPGKNAASDSYDSRYRDYYSEIRSRSVESGIGGGNSANAAGNLHIQSDTVSVSPVTVTVTHTVVKTTPHILPTATAEIALSSQTNSRDDSGNGEGETGENVENSDNTSAEKGVHPNLLPTPALPSSIFVNPTTTQSSFETGQGPAIRSHTVEDVQIRTSRYSTNQIGIQSTILDDDDDSHNKGNDQDQESHVGKQGNDEQKVQNTPVMPHQIQPTPTISSKNIKSVYFTQVEHPHFTSSSYEFTTSTMYSYSFPDHDSMHTYHPDVTSHDDHLHDDEDEQTHPESQSPSPEVEHGHSPEAKNANGTTISSDATADADDARTTVSDGRYFTPSPIPFWDTDSGNLTKSSSSQIPITIDQESAIPTPTIDIDIYPPLGTGPNSKPEDGSTTPVAYLTTGRPTSTASNNLNNNNSVGHAPGSLEENEISEEEQRKQQNQNAGNTTTTIKPSGVDTVTTIGKDKSEEDNETKSSSSGDVGKESNPSKDNTSSSAGIKTPFGVGESFGIGTVHVPIMVQIVLDVAQPVFCSHLSNFKRMIVTVYESQEKKTKVDPEQIVLYTEPGCGPIKPGDSEADASTSTTVTVKPPSPGNPTGKVSSTTTTTTPKGTFPLTSPPPPRDGEETKKPDSGKDINTGDTSLSAINGTQHSSESSDLNKGSNGELLNGNKSAAAEEESAHQNKSSSTLLRAPRSTKMGTAAATTKNANISGDIKENLTSSSSSTASNKGGEGETTENLLSVYFYVNNKNGSYDQELTSSFVKLWNYTSRLTNVSNGNNNAGSGEDASGNDGSNNNNNSSSEMFIKRVKKVGMISASQLISTKEPADENSGIIVAITVASIVAVCLFVLGVGLLIMRHRQSKTKFAKRCTPVTLDDYSLDNISVYNSFRRKQRLRGSKRSYTNAAFDDSSAPSRPVNAQLLATAISDVVSLENEFRAIPNITATLDDIPSGAETKNRYANVIPMPDTRVLLTFMDDVPNSDYINANFARGANGEQKRYIITQGPLEDTIVDFWRMVWEQQIRVILMLTDFAEGGIAKCAEYYPRSETIDCSQLHGDFQITLERRDIADNCITSYLVLKDMERNLRRDVVHFWYHSWPEKGVPASPKMTIDFLNRSKKFTKEPTPVLVHCSPGTGRSGTVVACEIAMKEYDAQNKVDIPRIVMKVRQDRAGAVQTKEQYVHIYDVLHSYASRIGATHLESI